mgnify:CR=1 FL=1
MNVTFQSFLPFRDQNSIDYQATNQAIHRFHNCLYQQIL